MEDEHRERAEAARRDVVWVEALKSLSPRFAAALEHVGWGDPRSACLWAMEGYAQDLRERLVDVEARLADAEAAIHGAFAPLQPGPLPSLTCLYDGEARSGWATH